jgi:hypothetical protein
MKLKYKIAGALPIMALLGYAVSANLQATRSADAPAEAGEGSPAQIQFQPLMVAGDYQSYSRTCLTAKGTCILEQPQKVGSQCECPQLGVGQVVR